ncbi:MAG: CARDB domain-containing protein [bacterium]|nr:CARDB domain-containing protein [bacterium]
MKHPFVRVIVLALAVTGLLMAAIPGMAQEAAPTPAPNPNANISWPPPVFVVSGDENIYGSANLPNMTNYFISFRPLNDDLTPAVTEFLPAVLPATAAVQDDVLGVWTTDLVDDGLYEIRLTVNVRGGQPVTHQVGPLRVQNEPPPPYVIVDEPSVTAPPIGQAGGGQVIAPPAATQEVIAPPTATFDPTPRASVRGANANVRSGDGTEFLILTSLGQGQSVVIVGISARGTGWYQVRLPDGRLGWMAPSVVDVSGNLNTVPSVQPPPPPPTATPLPPTAVPATAVPASSANLVAGVVVFDPNSPTCAQTFTVGFDVANLGSTATTASGTVGLTDVRAADGSVQGTTVGGFPVLQPGQTFRVNMPLTISTWYNETHRITLTIDSGNAVPESNEGDNTRTIEYTLQRGSCP